MNDQKMLDTVDIIDALMQEVVSGETKREYMPSAANDFSGEIQAEYFSNLRRFLQSSVCETIFRGGTK